MPGGIGWKIWGAKSSRVIQAHHSISGRLIHVFPNVIDVTQAVK